MSLAPDRKGNIETHIRPVPAPREGRLNCWSTGQVNLITFPPHHQRECTWGAVRGWLAGTLTLCGGKFSICREVEGIFKYFFCTKVLCGLHGLWRADLVRWWSVIGFPRVPGQCCTACAKA